MLDAMEIELVTSPGKIPAHTAPILNFRVHLRLGLGLWSRLGLK